MVEALKEFQLKDGFLVHNCDTSFDFDIDYLKNLLSNFPNCYSVVPVFTALGDHWSFVKTSENDPRQAVALTEKIRISSNCSIGAYYFRSPSSFLDDVINYQYFLEKNDFVGELYIAPFIDFMLQKKSMDVYVMPAKNHNLYGTPDELCESCSISYYELLAENAWGAHQRKTIVVDVDGTLCGPPIEGDYSRCKPVLEVIETLREHHKRGHYLILFTARNMRSFQGNIGLINKYTCPILLDWLHKNDVPYDEIIFGKPWGSGGVQYLDDKNLSINDFVSL